jgi:hypothetical protein
VGDLRCSTLWNFSGKQILGNLMLTQPRGIPRRLQPVNGWTRKEEADPSLRSG